MAGMPFKLSAMFALVAALGFGTVVGSSMYEAHRDANEMLIDVKSMVVAEDATARFNSLKQKYGERLTQGEICTTEFCSYELNTANDFLAALRLVPYTEMKTRFDLVNGTLALVMIEYRVALRNADSPVVHVQIDFCPGGCSWFYVHPWGRGSQQRSNGIVEFGSKAPAEEREIALAFNTTCFSNIGGCRDISEVLPTVWERTQGGKIACRIRTLSGMK